MGKIHFDHCYSKDQNHRFFRKLEKLGFSINPKMTSHPSANCRFIYFDSRCYLEFVSTKKPSLYERPGLSFRVESKLIKLFEKLNLSADFKCTYYHRNYDWRENSKDNLPGWNFLTFSGTGIRGFYPWFTEYESRNKKPIRAKKTKHPNGVSRIVGHVITVNSKGRQFFEKIFGPIRGDKLVVNGITLYFQNGRSNRHHLVVLGSKNWSRTRRHLKDILEVQVFGHHGFLIKNPSANAKMWNILVTKC